MTQQRIIELDPFFDKRDTGQPGPALQAMQQSPVIQAYGTPETEQLVRMRPTSTGLRGTLIPKATIGGIPQGTRPHSTQDVVVHVDPHISGQSSVIRLGDINARNVGQAVQHVSQIMEEPSDIVGLRVQGAAVMHTLANASRHDMVKQAQAAPSQPIVPRPMAAQPQVFQPVYDGVARQAQAQPPQQFSRPAPQQPQPQSPLRQMSPLLALNQRAQQQQNLRNLREIDIPPEAPPPFAVLPPQVQVVFEVEHFGRLDVNYHDVIIEQGFMVLVFDNRYQGAMKYFPPTQSGESPPRMAVNIVGTPDAYSVQTTGVQFEHDSREFCVLMIDQTWALDAGQ